MRLATPPPPVSRRLARFAVRHLAFGLPAALALLLYAADTWRHGDGPAALVEALPFGDGGALFERPIAAEALRARFLDDSTATVEAAPLRLHPLVRPFYAARAFAPLWTDRAARDTLTAALLQVEDEGLRAEETGADRLAARLEKGVEAESTRVDLELLLTDGYFRLADALLGRRADPAALYRGLWFPSRRDVAPAALLVEAVAAEEPGPALAAALTRLRPPHPAYAVLRAALARARADDGTPALPDGPDLAAGVSDPAVALLRQRLARTGDLTGPAVPDSVARRFDPALAAALARFQARHGLPASGALDAATREALARPGAALVPLLAVNLERWRWLPDALGDRHVWVNLPAYELRLRARDGARWHDEHTMRVVVGSRGRWRTPVFSDTISQVVFSPTWTIPASIQMESYGRVNPRGMVRGPGPGNPLGRVKFAFPNPHAIFLHDTNARSGFDRDARALSHGCIRLHEPQALAEHVMRGEGWDAERVAERFRGPWRTEPVDLAHPLPVHLVYFTAEPTPDGGVRVLDDVYRYDEPLAEALGYTAAELDAARAAAH